MSHPAPSPVVAAALAQLTQPQRGHLMTLRALIYDIAATLPDCRIAEQIKWGQPSYTTADTNAATPLRLGITKTGDVAIFTLCQTTVMSNFRALAPQDMRFDGNRAVLMAPDAPLPLDAIAPLIRAALTYRL